MTLGFTPLHAAVQLNYTIAAEYLMKYGANPDIQNNVGKYSMYKLNFTQC